MNNYLKVNDNNEIVDRLLSDTSVEGYVDITYSEHLKSNNYLKFNPGNREFSDPISSEYAEDVLTSHETITKEVHDITSMSLDDNIMNMDLIMALDDKLNLIMEHLGLC